MLNAILIDPIAMTVHPLRIQHGLDAMYEAIGCELVDCVTIGDGIDLWVDDEGLFNCPDHVFILPGLHQPIAGRALILSHDDDGETTSATVGFEQIRDAVIWAVREPRE